MSELTFNIWLGFGLFCVVSEFLLPGLVMVFVGLGALTVALAMHLGHIHTLPEQLTVFFVSSLIYLVTLRFFVLRFVPTSSRKEDIDEDHEAFGKVVEVIQDILPEKPGRIQYSESSWKATAEVKILKGEKAKIIGRDNITWIVDKL